MRWATAIMVRKSVSQKRKPLQPMWPLLLRNAWRTANVIINRYLGRPPRYCPVMLLFLTGRCNLRCRICGVCDLEHGYNDEEELSTEQWKGVISAAAEKLGTTLAPRPQDGAESNRLIPSAACSCAENSAEKPRCKRCLKR